jgi:succinate dehydrogenase / fumarate reductase cytochrome b subunit
MSHRPLSPHIQIYKPQITSVLSILHRFTGIALVCGMIPFCLGFFAFATSEALWKEFIAFWHSIGGKIWQWGFIFSLHYHALNGIRHLLWDFGFGFKIKTVTLTGIITLILSVITTLAFAHYCFIF